MKTERQTAFESCRKLLGTIVISLVVGSVGCTSRLWDEQTFAHYYRPATPNNLRLFYSEGRKDILVQYSEKKIGDSRVRDRCYWLDENYQRVFRGRKPVFKSDLPDEPLQPIPVVDEPAAIESEMKGLHAVADSERQAFTLYGDGKPLVVHFLPEYKGEGQRFYQVLLTPIAVAGDAAVGVGSSVEPGDVVDMLVR